MIIITEAEKAKTREYFLQGWNNTQITQRILKKRGDDIYPETYRAVNSTVADIKEDIS